MLMFFPGMDPYLEDPQIWPGVHNSLTIYIRDQLQPRLRPRYVATVEERVYKEGPERRIVPDILVKEAMRSTGSGSTAVLELDAPVVVTAPGIEIHESYIEIIDLSAARRIVTVIEVLSPTNKTAGPGRELYLAKQGEVLHSHSNLVEIDLLREGPHALSVPQWLVENRDAYDYLICVNRARPPRNSYELYFRRLCEPLPRFGIPLAEEDADVPLDLQAAIEKTYEAGAYADWLDYARPCQPLLSAEDQAWAAELLRKPAREPDSNRQ